MPGSMRHRWPRRCSSSASDGAPIGIARTPACAGVTRGSLTSDIRSLASEVDPVFGEAVGALAGIGDAVLTGEVFPRARGAQEGHVGVAGKRREGPVAVGGGIDGLQRDDVV